MTSVFDSLGYQVISEDEGVFVLHRLNRPGSPPVAGVLLTSYPLMTPAIPVKLFVQDAPAGQVGDVVALWKNLDARRFEETGLESVEFELGPVKPSDVDLQSYPRPDGGSRTVARLPTGDVLCFD
ncbi:hypothetical protein [Paraburkholderia sp. A3RO-2L]|jgi:hypothetical protein|uniref:hypothetical protein n=1 Tax=unclassified Paraburkholderia TaxID=2615204 RepID=UPI0032FD93C8|nr:hypothetical protein [Burkholderia vietnamiensis]